MKELFLDSANLDEISKMLRTDAIQGVTTNPSLMAKEVPTVSLEPRTQAHKLETYVRRLDDICQLFQMYSKGRKHLSVEVITLDPFQMYAHAHVLNDALKKHDKVQLHIKIPIMLESLEVITRLSDEGVKVNATAAISASQAKLAHDAGAPIISFFYRRGCDYYKTHDGFSDNKTMKSNIKRFGDLNRNSRVICGSIRTPEDVVDCWEAGSAIVTAPYKVIEQMSQHDKTTEAIETFQKDIEAWLK